MLEGLQKQLSSMKHGFGLLLEGAKNYVETYPERWKAKSTLGKIGDVLLGTAIAGCCVATFFFPPAGALVSGPALVAANVIGLGAYGMMLAAQSINKNGDVLKVMPYATGALAVQKTMLAGFGYATIAAIAFARTSMLGNIPQDQMFKRRLVAGGTWALGTAALVPQILLNPLNLLPFASMTMASIGDSLPNEWSHYSRLGRGLAFLSNAAYSGFFTHSALNVAMDLTVGQTAANSVKKFDIPKNPEGQKVPFMDRLALYVEKVLTFQPLPKVYPAPETTPQIADETPTWANVVDINYALSRSQDRTFAVAPAPDMHFNESATAIPMGVDVHSPKSAELLGTGACTPLRRVGIQLELAA